MKYFECVFSLALCVACFCLSRSCSLFFDNAKCKIAVPIRNEVLQQILIAKEIKTWKSGRLVMCEPKNESKMSLVGLLAHISIDTMCIRLLIVTFLYTFMGNGTLDMVDDALSTLIVIAFIFAIISTVNNSKVR